MTYLFISIIWVLVIGAGVKVIGGVQRKNEEQDALHEQWVREHTR